ncbi:MAG: hypothetical protein ACXWUG_16715 [Polyangiales bacterium]
MASSNTRVRAQRPRSALLLIEDGGLSAIVHELLLEEGFEVHEAFDLAHARRTLEAMRLGVVIVDTGMEMAALESFSAEIARRESMPGVVVLSELAIAATIAREHGHVFVRLPFDLEELVAAVERARTHETGRKRAAR